MLTASLLAAAARAARGSSGTCRRPSKARDERHRPGLKEVADSVYRHAELLVETFGDEVMALRDIRKHMAWYFKGYVGGRRAAG